MMKKRAISFIVILLLILGCSKQDETKVKIGVNLPLTGKLSYYGNEVKDALTIVKEQHKQSNIIFIFEDNQSQTNNSVTVFNKLSLDKLTPLIISCNSPLSIPLRPLAKIKEKVLLALVTGARDFGVANEWCFRDAINQDQEGTALAKYLVSKTTKRKGATFVVNDDYGLGGANAFKMEFEKSGGEILAEETFEMNERNMRNKILKLLNIEPEFVFLVGREQTIITAISQIRERDKDILIITSDAFDSPIVMKGVGGNAKGIVFASYHNNLESEKGKLFVNTFNKEFKRKPGIYAIDAFVAGNYILDLLKESGTNSKKLRNVFSTMQYTSQIKGKLKINEKRDVISPIAIYQINENLEKRVIHVVE